MISIKLNFLLRKKWYLDSLGVPSVDPSLIGNPVGHQTFTGIFAI